MPKMSKREAREVAELFERLRDMTTRLVATDQLDDRGAPLRRPALADLEGRVRALLAADEQVSRADGWGSSTPGNGSPGSGKGGRPVMAIPAEGAEKSDDALVPPDWVPVSSTERAVLTMPPPDPVHRQAQTVRRELATVVRSLETILRTLTRWETLRSKDVENPPHCYVIQVVLGLPFDIEWEQWRRTDFAGVLDRPFDEPRKVCSFVYWFARNHKRLPTKEEALKHLRSGKVGVASA